MPIDHPAVVVIVDHGSNRRVIERGGATVQAVQEFLADQLRLPTKHLMAEMIREPYFEGEEFDAVSYSEIVAAMAASNGPWDEVRWHIQHLLLLAVYEIDADRLIAPEDIARLPYC